MFLDTFHLASLVTQVQYSTAYELWDHAGAIGRGLTDIWPGIELVDGQPTRQIFRSQSAQIETGLKVSTINLVQLSSIDQTNVGRIKQTFDLWKEHLPFNDVGRISTRATYMKDFNSITQANEKLISLGLAPWPTEKVFDQPQNGEKNSFDLLYRFEDAESFCTLRIRTEQIIYEMKVDPAFDIENNLIKKTKNRIVVDFDRGLLGTVQMSKFRVEDWFKGFQHVLRRDINKVFRNEP